MFCFKPMRADELRISDWSPDVCSSDLRARAIQQDWTVMPLAQDGETRETDYRIASHQDRLSIRAEGQRSATGLALAVDLDVETCPYLEWDWRVERLQEGANP